MARIKSGMSTHRQACKLTRGAAEESPGYLKDTNACRRVAGLTRAQPGMTTFLHADDCARIHTGATASRHVVTATFRQAAGRTGRPMDAQAWRQAGAATGGPAEKPSGGKNDVRTRLHAHFSTGRRLYGPAR